MDVLKRLAATLPTNWQHELRRLHYHRIIRQKVFENYEREYVLLPKLISPGDWVIDVGANIGQYTMRCSELVGESGRVIAFEPVLETFTLLASNVRSLDIANVTLVNAAASDKPGIFGISIPVFDTGLANFYGAHLSDCPDSTFKTLALSIDSLGFTHRIALVKIDAEGHEDRVLKGLSDTLVRDRPSVIIETWSIEVEKILEDLDYVVQRLEGSQNLICIPSGHTTIPHI